MFIEKFNINSHMDDLGAWLKARNQRVPLHNEMPALGFVVRSSDHAVAMGFIRRVEGGFGQLDGLCTNPHAPAKDRNDAIDLVVSKLLQSARELEIKGLVSTSIDKNTLERSLKHGFTQQPHSVIAIDLSAKAPLRSSPRE